MPMTPEQIYSEALALGPDERERLADRIWRSIDGATQEEVAHAWADEFRRRAAAVDAGEMDTVAAEDVFAQVRGSRRKP
jgi:putative addiction module component (TIGR02574 family)